jgi:hypothetical protein
MEELQKVLPLLGDSVGRPNLLLSFPVSSRGPFVPLKIKKADRENAGKLRMRWRFTVVLQANR